MLRAAPTRRVRIAAAITLLLLLLLAGSELYKWGGTPDQTDFKVYLTAAQLVREHKGAEIYNGADTGRNPQMQPAPSGGIFQRTAAAMGIPRVDLYLYPPTLADMLVPLTLLSVRHACDAWLALNILALFLAAMLVTWMLYDTAFHWASIAFFVGIFCFRANVWGFGWGQIASVLLLLWTAGIVCYVQGLRRASAAIFALATAIKLTPLLVLLPFLFWREWRWVRWFSLFLASIALVLCLVNGPAALMDYFFHVMPPMSGGCVAITNISIPSGLQQLYLGLAGRDFLDPSTPVPHAVLVGSKMIASAVLLAVLFCIHRLGANLPLMERAKVLSLVALLSLYCSPVAWRSAYGIVFLAAFFLWKDAFERGASSLELLLLVVCTLEFSFFFDTFFLRFTHGVLLSATALVAPATGCVLIVSTLLKMGTPVPPQRAKALVEDPGSTPASKSARWGPRLPWAFIGPRLWR